MQIARDVTSGSLYMYMEKAVLLNRLFYLYAYALKNLFRVFFLRKEIASYLSHGERPAFRFKHPIIWQQNGAVV